MKKLNRKGFTLVELLAVIIILAIVVGISIPAITNIINDSKNNALGVAVAAAEDYITDQYSLMQLGSADATFTNAFAASKTVTFTVSETTASGETVNADIIKAMGFSTTDVSKVSVEIKDDGTACVTVKEIEKDGQYYTTAYWESETTTKTGAKHTSKGC